MDFFGLPLVWVFVYVVMAIAIAVPTVLYWIRVREWYRAKHRHFTVEFGAIRANQLMDKFKPVGTDPVETDLETIHLKRATGSLSVAHDSKKSEFNWNLEFRGKTLILSRSDGNLGANWVVEALESDYHRRYGAEDALYPVATLNEGKVAHATVDDPQKFFEYLHLLKTFSRVQINNVASRRAKNLRKRMTESV